MLERMESQMDMIRWSLVEQDYEADIFADDGMAAATGDPRGRRASSCNGASRSGELHGDPKKLALTFMGFVFMHVLARKKFPDSELHQGGTDAALRFYIDVFLNGVRNR